MAQPVDEESDHAPRVIGLVVAGGHAQACDRAQYLVGIEIGANRACRPCGLDESPKGRPKPLLEPRGQGLERRIA